MRGRRENPEAVALKLVFPALLFAAVWLRFPYAVQHFTVSVNYTYCLLALIALVLVYRVRLAARKPNSPLLRYLPAFDSVVLAVIIRFTGGVHSDLWLFYYFQLVVSAMDPKLRTIEILAPMVLVSYLGGTIPAFSHWNWALFEVIGTRLFFLMLTAVITLRIARSRRRLSDELSELSEQLSLSQERNRIAREIHDGIGHSLVNCILTLELCERLICKEPNEACKVIEQEKIDLRTALDDMRDFVHHLRPAEIENEEFVTLVKRYVEHFAERTGVSTHLSAKSKHLDLPPSCRLVLLRILQEALTNAAKHSEATQINVNLAPTADMGVHCVISDNGVGFDEDDILRDAGSKQGFGLRAMRDRAKGVGGDLQIESAPGDGTRISVYIPG